MRDLQARRLLLTGIASPGGRRAKTGVSPHLRPGIRESRGKTIPGSQVLILLQLYDQQPGHVLAGVDCFMRAGIHPHRLAGARGDIHRLAAG
jgi:hypothetical protein